MSSIVITPKLAQEIAARNSTLSSMKNVTTNDVLLKQFEDLARIVQAAPTPRTEVTFDLTFPITVEEADIPGVRTALTEGLAHALHPSGPPLAETTPDDLVVEMREMGEEITPAEAQDMLNETGRKKPIAVKIVNVKKDSVDKNNPTDRTTVTFSVTLPKRRFERDPQMTRAQLVRTIKAEATGGSIVENIRTAADRDGIALVPELLTMAAPLPEPSIVPSTFEQQQADARAKGAMHIAHYTQKVGPRHVDTIRARDNQEQLLKRRQTRQRTKEGRYCPRTA